MMTDTMDAVRAAIAEIDEMQHDDLIIVGLDRAVLDFLGDPENLEIMLNREDCEVLARKACYTDGTKKLYSDPAMIHLSRWMLDNGYAIPQTNAEMSEAVNPADIPCDVNEVTANIIGKASVNAWAIDMCADWREEGSDACAAYTDAV